MSSVPNKFILNSSFTTQKNDSRADGTINIIGGSTITSGNTASASIDLLSGSIGATSRGRIASTRNSMNWYVSQAVTFQRTGTVGGSPVPYQIVAFIRRSSPTTITFQILIKNIYGGTLTTQAGNETIFFYSNQFIAPYA